VTQQPYTYYAWVDADNVIRESGYAPTASLGEYPNWQRTNGWRYVEHDLPELVSDATHYVDTDGTIKRRELPAATVAPEPRDMPPLPRSIHNGNH
jgi:hypothetical protein